MTYQERISAWVRATIKRGIHGPILDITTEDYAAYITHRADWHLSPLARIVEISIDTAEPNYKGSLLRALGCRYLDVTRDCLFYPYVPPVEHVGVVRSTLARTLKSHFEDGGYEEDAVSLLDGFLRDNIWQDSLETTESAFDFARLLIVFAGYPAHHLMRATAQKLRAAILPDLCNVLNGWMNPAEPIQDINSASQMARLLFGEVWCDLFLEGLTRPSEINNIIGLHEPTFLPGLLHSGLQAQSEMLPDLMTP